MHRTDQWLHLACVLPVHRYLFGLSLTMLLSPNLRPSLPVGCEEAYRDGVPDALHIHQFFQCQQAMPIARTLERIRFASSSAPDLGDGWPCSHDLFAVA